jgi:polysaccharide biosynthesis transport protein
VNTVDNKQTAVQGLGISLGDIYYVLFRQKLKIVLLSAMGILASTGFYMFKPPLYQSEAKLFILYVVTTQVPKMAGPEANVKSPDERGENIMNSEVEILTSLDLIKQTVTTITPEKILAKAGGGNDPDKAAALVKSNLIVETGKRSDVIRVVFQHPDPDVVRPFLGDLIENYIKRHIEIHRAVGIIHEFLTQETDQMRSRLEQTEQELHNAKSKADVLSLDDAKRSYTDQISDIRRNILSATAELAERQAELQEMRKSMAAPVRVPVVTPVTSTVPAAPAGTPPPEVRIKPDDEYQSVVERLDFLRKRKLELRTQYTEGSVLVKGINDQIVEAEKRKRQLEAANPGLTMISVPSATAAPAAAPVAAPTTTVVYPQAASSYDPVTEAARIMALQTRIKILNAQLDQIRAETAKFDEKGDLISELQRKKDLQEASYRFYASNLEQARIEEALGAGKVLNIHKVQTPSPPTRDWFITIRIMGMIVGAGILAGLVLAFVSDMYLDRSVRRPVDVEKKLRLPLLLTIRDIGWFGRRRVAKATQRMMQHTDAGAGGLAEQTAGLVPKLFSDPLLPFYETLRDRLDQRLESRNIVHKPKFIGITAVDAGAGVTTLATGLAVSLSETENRNVLLIDLDRDLGVAKQFFKGQITEHSLAEAMDPKYKVLLQDGGSTGGEPDFEKIAHVLRNQYGDILKKLKASEYDCVVFDMSPIAPTSITLRLAGFMDEVVLIVESEKTNQDVARDGIALLLELKTGVSAVLNKTRNYVPSALHQEFWGGV